MTVPPFADWALVFLQSLYRAQIALARALHAVGLTGDADGQAAWPWARRIALETLRIDAGLTRQLALACAATALAVALGCVAVASRRWRVTAAIGALALAWCTPWPPASLWLAPAVPTSFQRSPVPFSVATVMHGANLYARHCAACHGADGRGEGPLAATLAHWPPTFAGTLLARRLDGELYWHVRHGMRDAHDASSMPGFAATLDAADTWAVLDYLKALSAGSGARTAGAWPVPVPLPALDVRCGEATAQPLARWREGQRVRIVALRAGSAPPPERPALAGRCSSRPRRADAAVHWPRGPTALPRRPARGARSRRSPACRPMRSAARSCSRTAAAGCGCVRCRAARAGRPPICSAARTPAQARRAQRAPPIR
ncbi:cytochrome c, class I [Burkholderia multivorans CGD2]|uniref:Cytochrome c, class I n=1 Tax=Burkholderia multivorans CGD2 TaxID=513052 RepID=B9BIP8_9BURK|nr:cytochrome c [Burkholderia multivorans]EEE09581.1 cytochrome c, class I [Burkholderia multivorans CGD2]